MDENPYQTPAADPSRTIPREPQPGQFRLGRLAMLLLIVLAILIAIGLLDALVVEFIRSTTPKPPT